jgi:hypothetical protein
MGASDIPNYINQCWTRCEKWLPGGEKFHTLGIVAICWSIWKARNKLCFEGKMVKTPLSIICNACALMSYWAGLYPAEDKDTLVARVNAMLQIAVKLLSRKAKPGETPLLQDDGGDRDEDRRNLMLGGIGFLLAIAVTGTTVCCLVY